MKFNKKNHSQLMFFMTCYVTVQDWHSTAFSFFHKTQLAMRTFFVSIKCHQHLVIGISQKKQRLFIHPVWKVLQSSNHWNASVKTSSFMCWLHDIPRYIVCF